MNKRQRKKWLKQHNMYASIEETFNLDYTIATYILPRLQLFRKVNDCYPTDTPEMWDEILDKMIIAFEYLTSEKYENGADKAIDDKVDEGLRLFAKWFQSLWW